MTDITQAVDLSPILTPVLQTIGTVVAAVATSLVGWGVSELHKRNLISLTDQQRAQLIGAVQTSAGMLTTELAKRTMPLEQLHSGSPQVLALAQRAVAAVPNAAAALGVTPETVAQMIIGVVGNALPSDPTVTTLPQPASH